MGSRVIEYPVIFDSGWDTRGADVGQPVMVKDMWNAWLSRWENGSIESMPGEAPFIDWSSQTSNPIYNLAVGTNQNGKALADGDTEDILEGTVSIIGSARYGEVVYKHYTGTTTQGKLTNTFGTSSYQWAFASMPRLNDKFHIFQAVPSYDSVKYPEGRNPQVTDIGSLNIDDIGVPRPIVEVEDIYVMPTTTPTSTNVRGVVKYWISAVEEGNESALSDALPRYAAVQYGLRLNGQQDQLVTWPHYSEHEWNPTSGQDWSMEILIRVEANDKPPASRYFLQKDDGTYGWAWYIGGQGKVNFQHRDGSNTYVVTSDDDICDGLWHRITVTYENLTATTGTFKLYKDNDLQDTQTCDPIANGQNVAGMQLGVETDRFRFDISDIRIYNALLASGNINDSMHKSIPDPSVSPDWDDLRVYFDFSAGSGSTLEDVSGVSTSDGTLPGTNPPAWVVAKGLGARVVEIDAEEGGDVDIVFVASKWMGKRWRIYRSVADGAQPFYLETFQPDSGDYTYIDKTLDEDLGDLPYLHGDIPPATTKTDSRPAVAHINRIFTAVGNRVYWTDITSDESYFTQDNGNWINVFPDDGDKITALVSDFDSLLIFKSNHIYRLSGRRPEEFSLRPVVAGTDITVSVGTPSPNSVCATPEGVFFYWNRKVFALAGGTLQVVSAPISEKLDALSLVSGGGGIEYYTVSVGYWAARNQLWVSVGDATSTPGKTFIYSLSTGRWIGMRNRGYYSAQSVRGLGSWVGTLTDEKFIGSQPAAGNGAIAQIVDTTSTSYLNAPTTTTTTYASYAEFSPFYGGNLNTQKRFFYVDVIFKPTSTTDDKLEVIWWVDGDSSAATTVEVPMDANAIGIPTTQTRYRARVNINEVGQSLSVKVNNVPNTDGPWKVYGMVYGYHDLPSLSR